MDPFRGESARADPFREHEHPPGCMQRRKEELYNLSLCGRTSVKWTHFAMVLLLASYAVALRDRVGPSFQAKCLRGSYGMLCRPASRRTGKQRTPER